MELVDTHAHLTHPALLPQIGAVLARARAADVHQIVAVASDARDSHLAIELAHAHPGVFATAGIHPHEAAKAADGDFAEVRALLANDRVVACGEIGLDYHYDFAAPAAQQQVFARQLGAAGDINKPLVIHCREALDDCIRLLNQHGYRDRAVVFHCFTGSAADALRIADHGWRISFTGIVTFKGLTELQDIARSYPADLIMVETDAPYLSPVPVRHVKSNEPAHVTHTARFLADLRGTSFPDFAEQTSANARTFFGLSQPG